jgi:transposase
MSLEPASLADGRRSAHADVLAARVIRRRPVTTGRRPKGSPRGAALAAGIRRKEARGNRLEERGTRVRGSRIG